MKKKTVELNPEKLNELLSQMPEEAREIFLYLLAEKSSNLPHEQIQVWLDQFDEDSAVDMLLSNIIMGIIGNVGSAVSEDIENIKSKGEKVYCIYDGMKIAIKELKKMTIEFEEKLQTLINIDNEDIKH